VNRWQDRLITLLAALLFLLALVTVVTTPREARGATLERIFADGFEEGEPGGPVDPCLDPLVMPAGWLLKQKTWVAAFSNPSGTPQATYPNSVGFPVPVPGYEQWHRSGNHKYYLKGQIVAIGFVAEAGTTVDITWDGAQSGPNYTMPRPARMMHFTLSVCPWDVRPTVLCSLTAGAGSLFHSTRTDITGSFCPLIAGNTYYLNAVMADPNDGLTPGEHTCSDTAPNSANGCDVQMRHTGTFGVLKHQRLGGWKD
jgi:hypothetical protein